MKIGLILHSKSGNTRSVAEHIKTSLEKAGHTVVIENLIPHDEAETDPTKIKLTTVPSIRSYDGFILACPVRGASISPTLTAFLRHVDSFEQKKVAYFVTEYFPFKWMGGSSALSKLTKLIQNKGAVLVGCDVINWKNRKRSEQIKELTSQMVRWF